MKIILFGTSRIHRPFAKFIDNTIHTNIINGIEVIFPKIGYFHTSGEILQAIQFIENPEVIPARLRKYIFRIEPRKTTPFNEFDKNLEESINNEQSYYHPINIGEIDGVIIEVSSLTAHSIDGVYLHTNPNFEIKATYSSIYPNGFYATYKPELPVIREVLTESKVKAQIKEIQKKFTGKKIIILGHLRSVDHPDKTRDKLHDLLFKLCAELNITYVDTAPFLQAHGWATMPNGDVDKHHLSYSGEDSLGEYLQKLMLSDN